MISHQIIRFVVVGGLAAATHLSVVFLLVENFALRPLIANIFAFVSAFCVSYFGHSMWSFSHKSHQHRKTVIRFLSIAVGGFALNESMYYLLLYYTNIHYIASLLFVVLTIAALTFLLSKYWAFS